MEGLTGKRSTDLPSSLPKRLAEWKRLLTTMPASVKAAISPDLWNRDLLYALDLATDEVPIADLAWLFDVPLWAVDDIPFQVTPNQVRANPDQFVAQYDRTMDADLAWPIHIVRHNQRWTILDGVHRLLKADMLGHRTIHAMILGPEDYASIMYRPGAGIA